MKNEPNKPWSKDEDKFIIDGIENGVPLDEIADVLERTEGAVRSRADVLGVSRKTEVAEIGYSFETSCEFCGQISLIGEPCICDKAKEKQAIDSRIYQATQKIEEIFGESCKETGGEPVSESDIEILNAAVALIANDKMQSIAYVLNSGTKAKLVSGSNGIVKIERSDTKKLTAEV